MRIHRYLPLILVTSTLAFGQSRDSRTDWASNVIIPQTGVLFRGHALPPLEIEKVQAAVEIQDQVAVTTLTVHLKNPANTPQEAELVLPVPAGAAIHGFDFLGNGKKTSADLLPADQAVNIYNSIVSQMRDPAIMEFSGLNMIRTSVFPVQPGSGQIIRLSYSEVLKLQQGRVGYALPRSELLSNRVQWEIAVSLHSKKEIATVYSPSHAIESIRKSPRGFSLRLLPDSNANTGSFLLFYVPLKDEVTASLMACPDSSGKGGHFLLLAGIPPMKDTGKTIRREVTFVLDKSGSMAGEKIEQAKEAARQVLESLREDECFNFLIFSDSVNTFSAEPVPKTKDNLKRAREYLSAVEDGGGTNLHDALQTALQQPTSEDVIRIVLFLTDGCPTVGNCEEIAIRDLVTKQNPHKRRVFAFGVGYDVNSPLLDAVAADSKACPVYVSPEENVEVKVASLFSKLKGPILMDPVLVTTDSAGKPQPSLVTDVLPARMGDLYSDSQVVVLGRYMDASKPLYFRLQGKTREGKKEYAFDFKMDKANPRNHFVPRLWASRKVAGLVESIRRMGADPTIREDDPRVKELSDSVLALSTKYGILTEYTAFLATEGSMLTNTEIRRRVNSNFVNRAVKTRRGRSSANQSKNRARQQAARLNTSNTLFDEGMNTIEFNTVQQVADLNLYNRNGRWVDNRVIRQDNTEPKPDRIIRFGSPEYIALVELLTTTGRQGALAMDGDLFIQIKGENILISDRNPDTKQQRKAEIP